MKRKWLGTMLILGGMLNVAHADTWVMRDTLRPNGHERSMAAKRADARKCGAAQGGRSFNDATAPNMQMHAGTRLGARSCHPRSAAAPCAVLGRRLHGAGR